MKRVLALVALTAALAGCQSMQRSVFGQPTTTTTVSTAPASRPTPIISAPVAAPSQPYTYQAQYQPAPAQPVFTPAPAYGGGSAYVTPPSGPQYDLTGRPMDAGQRGLLDADRSFSEIVLQRGLAAAVASVADPEGTMLATTNTAGSLNLIPEKATLSSSQDFGQTTGRFVQVIAGGKAIQGRYLTVWRKNGNTWRVLSYASTTSPVARPVTPAVTPRRR